MTDTSMALTELASVFAPISNVSRADAVTQRLGDAIALGALPDGAALPPEAELAAALGVATATVREALSSLRSESLVVTRRGRGGGSFVQAPLDGVRAALHRRLRRLGQGELRDLGDHYAAISGKCAALAAMRADPDEVTRLRRGAAPVAGGLSPGGRVRTEGAFHLGVATAAQSARLTRAELDLQAEVGFILWLGSAAVESSDSSTRHAELVDAIASRRPEHARTVAEQHIEELMRALRPLHRAALVERR